MIGIEFIVPFAMAIVNAFKKHVPAASVPFLSIGLAIVCNLLNAYLFKGDLLEAGRAAFIAGGIAVGMFVAGDAVRNSPVTSLKSDR